MEIALIITGGIIVITLITVIGDYFGKKKIKPDKELESRIATLENKMNALESLVQEKDTRINQLENDVHFVNKLIEGKNG